MLRQRVLTAVIALPLLITTIWLGAPWFTFFMAAIAIKSGLEFYQMASHHKIQPIAYLGTTVILLLVLSPHCPNITIKPLLITSAIVISLIWLLFRSSKEHAFNNWAWTMAGVLYIGWTLSYWVDLRNLEFGREWVFWLASIIVVNDISAFFIGRAWGKHSLSPVVSPKKTWEGAIGGLLASIAISAVLGVVFALPLHCWQMVFLGCVVSVLAQFGDLVESLLKRNMNVKDSGKFLPGHGGMLDRIDSYIFTGAAVYYVINLTL